MTHPGKGNPDDRQARRTDRSRRRRARGPRRAAADARAVRQFRLPPHGHGRKRIHGRLCLSPARNVARGNTRNAALPVGFLLGAAGDVTQVDNLRPGREFGDEWAAMFGLALGAEVAPAIGRLMWHNDAEVRAVQTRCPNPDPRARDMAMEAPAIGLGAGADADKIYARERELVDQERARRPVIPCEVQAIRIGDLGIVTNGAEFFCQLGLDIKAASPFARTWVVSLANQWIGYVATPSAYYAGGYEPRTARSAKLAPWAGQSLVEGSLAALRQVHELPETPGNDARPTSGQWRSVGPVAMVNSAASEAAHPIFGREDGTGSRGPGRCLPARDVALRQRHLLDPLLDHLRRLADHGRAADHAVTQWLLEDHGVVEQASRTSSSG